ncbi:MAG: ATP-binding protein [Acidimicrobiales bacterium]
MPAVSADARAFDLNIEKVLEHWPVAYALREFIANALDEQVLSDTAEPMIEKDRTGRWVIRDFGRGVRYEHLTQKENREKLRHPSVIGQFGIGLKDALAVCDRRGVEVMIRSRYGDISTKRLPKAGFPDVVTLHGVVEVPSDPARVGTQVELADVPEGQMEKARAFFLRYNGDTLLESTKYGDVLARGGGKGPGRVYVKGLLVADEPNFLFSYNIRQLNAGLRRALNRERTNVGRGAYSDRVKDILKESRSPAVAEPLTADLSQFVSGRMHDELSWKDVAIHACRVLQASEKVVFVTPWQLTLVSVSRAQDDGYRPVVVPDEIARALGGMSDLEGNPMFDIGRFQDEWNQSFVFELVLPADMTDAERSIYDLARPVTELAGFDLRRCGVKEICVSEKMRLSEAGAEVLGVWDPAEARVVVRRDQLGSPAAFCGTLLHELEHATSGHPDGTLAFEEALTHRLGTTSSVAIARLEAGAASQSGRRPR